MNRLADSPTVAQRPWVFGLKIVGLAKEAGMRWVDDSCYRLGASLAYYALFSLFPLLLLAVSALGFVLGSEPTVREQFLGSVASASSPEFRTLLDQTLQSMQTHRTARGVGALVGIVTLFFGASSVFSELESSLNTIWRVKSAPFKGLWPTILGAVKDKAFSFAVVLGAAAALLLSLAVSTAIHALGATARGESDISSTAWFVVEMSVSIGLLTLLFAAIFRMVPQTEVRWGDVFGGALVTSLLLTGLKHALAWYLAHLGSYAAYGAVGAVLGLLYWIYLAGLFLFFGAEFTRVYAERYGSLAQPREARPPSSVTVPPRSPQAPLRPVRRRPK
jgi:membrane protein